MEVDDLFMLGEQSSVRDKLTLTHEFSNGMIVHGLATGSNDANKKLKKGKSVLVVSFVVGD